MTSKILLIDDDQSLLRVTAYQLRESGYEVLTAGNGQQGLELFNSDQPDLVLTDINMPGKSGLEVISGIRRHDQQVPVIVITAYGSLDNAIRTTQSGANDYLTKPFSIEALRFVIEKNLQLVHLRSENSELRQQLFDKYRPENIIGQSAAMKRLLDMVDKAAGSDASVLILGESGTGKELIARAIHHKSKRATRPFVAVNCAAIPENLIESELFGHVRGAFTGALRDAVGKFEAADGGTLFLDEIGDLNLELQSKLLRVLQDHEIRRVGENRVRHIDVRILAATHQNLEQMAGQGTFRQDLFYRLNVLPLSAPPLRDRREDIPLLLNHFIRKLEPARRIRFSDRAIDLLVHYDWPGNIRELENMVERLSILYAGSTVEASQISLPAGQGVNLGEASLTIPFPEDGISLGEIEKIVIHEALKRHDFNQSRAAKFLKVPRHVLLYRMKKWGLG